MDLLDLRNNWTDIPPGTKVQKLGRVDGTTRSWFGTVVQFVEPTGRGVKVEWGPDLFSWEDADKLFLASDDLT